MPRIALTTPGITSGAIIADNALVRGDGGGSGVQGSGITVSDTDAIAAVSALSIEGVSDAVELLLKMEDSQTANPLEIRDSDNDLQVYITATKHLLGLLHIELAGYLKAPTVSITSTLRAPELRSGPNAGNAIDIGGEAIGADVAPGDITIVGQSAKSDASASQDGADVVFVPGNHAAGGGVAGAIIFRNADDDATRMSMNDDGTLTVAGGRVRAIATKTNDYTVLPSDFTILADATSNAVTITLPAAPVQGQMFFIKCINADNTCTIARNGKNIDGAASDVVMSVTDSVPLQYDSTYGWAIL